MATRRKPSLADIRPPQGPPPIRGGNPSPVRTRPVRITRLQQTLTDFRGLSRSASALIDTMADAQRLAEAQDLTEAQEQQLRLADDETQIQTFGQALNPESSTPLPIGPELNGSTPIDGNYRLEYPEENQAVRKEIAKRSRSGGVRPIENPLVIQYARERSGSFAFSRAQELIAPHLADFATYDDTPGKGGPVKDIDQVVRDAASVVRGEMPFIDPSSPDYSPAARRQFVAQLYSYVRKTKIEAQAALNEDMTQKILEGTVYREFSTSTDSILGSMGAAPTQAEKDQATQAMSRALSQILEEPRENGLKFDETNVKLSYFKSKLRELHTKYEDDPLEHEESLDNLMTLAENVRIGQVKGGDHQRFEELEVLRSQLQPGGRRGQGGSPVIDRSIVKVAAGPLADLQAAFFDNDALNNREQIAAAKQDFDQAIEEQIAERELSGYQALEFRQGAAETWANQITANRRIIEQTQAAVVDGIVAQYRNGQPDEARAALHLAVRSGSILATSAKAVEQEFQAADQAAPHKAQGSAFRIGMDTLVRTEKAFTDLGLPQDIASPLVDEFNRRSAAFDKAFNAKASALLAEGKTPEQVSDAMTEWMNGTGQQLLDRARQPLLEKENEVRAGVADVRAQTNNRKRLSEDEWQRLVPVIGAGEVQRLRAENLQATDPMTLFQRISTAVRLGDLELSNEVDKALANVADLKDKSPEERDAIARSLKSQFAADFSRMALREIQGLTKGGHPQFQDELLKRVAEKQTALVEGIPERAKDIATGERVAARQVEVRSAVLQLDALRAGGYQEFRGSFGPQYSKLFDERVAKHMGPKGLRALGAFVADPMLGANSKSRRAAALKLHQEAKRAGKAIEASNLPTRDKAQLQYDLAAMTGAADIGQIERGVYPETVDLRAFSSPLFRSERSLRSFVSSPDRFYKLAQRLGFPSLDSERDPLDHPAVVEWVSQQKHFLRLFNR